MDTNGALRKFFKKVFSVEIRTGDASDIIEKAAELIDPIGGSSWNDITDKPFESIGGSLTVDEDGEMNANLSDYSTTKEVEDMINDIPTKEMVVTYDDDTTETFNVLIQSE